MSNKVPYQKKPYQESKKGVLSRNLKKSLKRESKKASYQEFTQNTS